jgi:hypothetical protein
MKNQKSKVKGQKSKVSRSLRAFDGAFGALTLSRIRSGPTAAFVKTFDL